ncbi:LysM peptidoglycan-binding domain-containing protein [Arthrobacter sp. LAPM80]|uniref:LysM peptidoglycan-binding domain-containing protein n=1 Tax=Arthrobacter sp. LAPM80 TaxID=3141788 RepID=UPI00398AFEBF
MNAMVISAATLGSTRGNLRLAGAEAPADTPAEAVRPGTTWFGLFRPGVDCPGGGRQQLTRRGRLVFLGIPAIIMAVVVVFAALAIVLGSVAAPAHAAVQYAPVDMADYAMSVTVLQGQSLWTIAAESNPSRDTREVMGEIVALNELDNGAIQAGQRLFVPIPR